MQTIPKQVYTKEYREQATKLVLQEGLTIAEAARRLSMSVKTLSNWVQLARHFALKLGEGQQHIEHQSAHGRGGVELLGDRDK
jgi:transposase